jgi:hypothetical protein
MTPQGKMLEGKQINPYSKDQTYWTGQKTSNNTDGENPAYMMYRSVTVGPSGILDHENNR